ncbi:MAG TPA: hypothetical protein VN882_15965, partial [Steroidobacteraceae bacterium]|nr:hypothetical protein [Steroidobacteraceae bacterium]
MTHSHPRTRLPRAAWCALMLLAAAAGASAETDASFLLSASGADLQHYFPTYLANGYFSTLSSPRGTAVARSYVAGLMDYTPGD